MKKLPALFSPKETSKKEKSKKPYDYKLPADFKFTSDTKFTKIDDVRQKLRLNKVAHMQFDPTMGTQEGL